MRPTRAALGVVAVAGALVGRGLDGVGDDGALRMVWTLVQTMRVAPRLLLDPGHAVMEVVQLRGIRRRAEGYLAGQAPM